MPKVTDQGETDRVGLRSNAYYRQLAEKAITELGPIEPPVPMDGLAARYRIPVRLVKMPGFFHGAIINEDGLPVIVLNSVKDEYVHRVTLAHMLGHVFILLSDSEYTYPRDRSLEHPEADVIADELLMPAKLVSEEAQKWFNDYRYLARLFGVTEQDMMARMRDLGIIKAQGIMWDY